MSGGLRGNTRVTGLIRNWWCFFLCWQLGTDSPWLTSSLSTKRRSFLLLLKESLIFAMVKKKSIKLNPTFTQLDSMENSQDKLYGSEVIKTGLKYGSRELLNNAIILFQNKPGLLWTTNHSLWASHSRDREGRCVRGGGSATTENTQVALKALLTITGWKHNRGTKGKAGELYFVDLLTRLTYEYCFTFLVRNLKA